MSAVTASLCWTLIPVFFPFVSADQINIITVPGQTVTLPCRAPNENSIIVVEWRRRDLETEYVLLYRDERFDPENQHPSFKNRVDLQDRQMKDGDVSLILKDVTTADHGIYQCHVVQTGTNHIKTYHIIYLSVVPPDKKNITVESGQNINLTCRAPNTIIRPGAEWSRRDLKTQYVLFYWDTQSVPYFQHPSFVNRVELQDKQMKDGDVSLTLKDVTINDTGTYECRVIHRLTDHGKTAILKTGPISIIYLRVAPPPGSGGGTTEDGAIKIRYGPIASLILFVLIPVAIFVWYRKQKVKQK